MAIMGRKSNLELSLSKINAFFNSYKDKVFARHQLQILINNHKTGWGVSDRKNSNDVIDFLLAKETLIENTFFDTSNKEKIVYSWNTRDHFTIIQGLKPDSYYTHYTAAFFHQLTLQIPKTIYLNHEHYPSDKVEEYKPLSQIDIDEAFKNQQRKSSNMFVFFEKRIVMINGKYTGRLGVIEKKGKFENFDYTDLERTIIDITVRPGYSGGVSEVLNAYKKVKPTLNVQKLYTYLSNMNFKYPYHQAVGFYLDAAGYKEKDLALFSENINLNFYLTYNIRRPAFSDRWKLFYPQGLI